VYIIRHQGSTDKLNHPELSETRNRFIAALKAPDFAAFRRFKIDDPLAGTLEWVLDDEFVRGWLDKKEESCLLWVKGSPGQGKTVLSKFLLDELEKKLVPKKLKTPWSSTSSFTIRMKIFELSAPP